MSTSVQPKLEGLRTDYNQFRGHPFAYFYCPILFRDEDVSLCKAHIINQAFPDSTPDWTVQRKDVDNFYGSAFEADFIAFRYHEDRSIGNALTDKTLSKKLNPQILLDDKQVGYFFSNRDLPEHFTRLDIEHEGQVVQLGLKMSLESVLAATSQKWEVAISKDIRIPALVSLIKAAHLTLFDMLGYRYALSCGGHFVGRQILGDFFLQNYGKAKPDIIESARPFFREFAHMVRPLQANSLGLQGTITDKLLFICGGYRSPWALVVFIRTSQLLSAVLIPIFDQPDTVASFLGFLKNKNDLIPATLCRFEQGQWNIDKESFDLSWPKDGILYPE